MWTALSRNRAETCSDAADPRLRGRDYAIPFAEVWHAAHAAAGELRGWRVVQSDPGAGEIVAEARTRWLGFTDDVRVRISLDEMGSTRVDLVSASRAGHADLGINARRIARFLHRLDRRLAATVPCPPTSRTRIDD